METDTGVLPVGCAANPSSSMSLSSSSSLLPQQVLSRCRRW